MPAKTNMSTECSLMSELPRHLQGLRLDLSNHPRLIKYGRYKIQSSKSENIERCINLLDHIGNCKDPMSCNEGEGCRRTKQVLAHYWTCVKARKECCICHQFMDLCEMHAERCQKKPDCNVPHSHNEKRPMPLLLKELLEKSNVDSADTSYEFVQVVRKLVSALRMPTVAEKKQHILHLYKRDPQTTGDLLRKLYKMKRSKMGSNHVTSSVPIGKKTSYTKEAIGSDARGPDEPMNEQHIIFKAKVMIV